MPSVILDMGEPRAHHAQGVRATLCGCLALGQSRDDAVAEFARQVFVAGFAILDEPRIAVGGYHGDETVEYEVSALVRYDP